MNYVYGVIFIVVFSQCNQSYIINRICFVIIKSINAWTQIPVFIVSYIVQVY